MSAIFLLLSVLFDCITFPVCAAFRLYVYFWIVFFAFFYVYFYSF